MQTAHTQIFGNIMDINQTKSGKIKFINIAQATFKEGAVSKKFSIKVFERDFDKIAELETALAEVREISGNPKAALKNVKIDARLSMMPADKEKGLFKALQLVFYRINDTKKTAQPAEVASADAPVEVAAEDVAPF